MFDIIKNINTPYYNNRNIEALISKNIITIIAKTINIIKLPREKNSKTLTKEEEKKTKTIIIIVLIMEKNSIKEKKGPITLTKEQTKNKNK